MLEDVIKENLQIIIESIALIEERFEKINSADDFVSNAHGTFVLDAISMRLQVVGELLKKIENRQFSF